MTSNGGDEARVAETSVRSETIPTEKSREQEPTESPSADQRRSAKTEAAPAEADLSETDLSETDPSETEDDAPSPASEPRPAGAENSSGDGPPLPEGPPPGTDDGWEYHWDPNHQVYFFYNRYTQQTTWENPRVSGADDTGANTTAADLGASSTPSVAGGYNPAIHGDYDPNAWYAQGPRAAGEAADLDQAGASELAPDPSLLYVSGGHFNRRTGEFQMAEQGADRHGDEAKSRRQMNAYFDVDAAANAHGGRSLRAERAGKKPSKAELKQFKEKRRAKKEEKRRAWLRD